MMFFFRVETSIFTNTTRGLIFENILSLEQCILCIYINIYFFRKRNKIQEKKYVEATNTTYFNIKIICSLKKIRKAKLAKQLNQNG